MDYFGLRVHVYQAKDLPCSNPTGIANAFVEVRFCGKKMKTHTVKGSNSPTWDETLAGRDFNEIELPCLGWPGQVGLAFLGQEKSDPADWKYNPKDEEWEFKPETDEFAERWMFNYRMLRMAPRIEVRVMESQSGQNMLLGRCFIRPEDCFHTQCDPDWYELFDGVPEVDEGCLYMGVQMIHCKDPLYKAGAAELAPQRTDDDQIARAQKDEIPNWSKLVRKMWNPHEMGILGMKDRSHPLAFFNRNKMPCANYAEPVMLAASEVVMRECRVQIQILGLRNLLRDICLTSPSLHVFIQTTEQWNADESSYKATKDKSLPIPHEVNLKEQLQLEVLLPDDPEYAPNLEFVVMDKQGIFMPTQEIMCWGTVALRDLYPQGEKPEELEEADDEEDEATRARREKAEKKVNFEKLIGALLRQGTVTAKEAKKLVETFKTFQGKGSEIEEAFDLYLAAPSDAAFLQRTEDFLLKAEKRALQQAAKEAEKKQKAEDEKKKKKTAQEAKDKADLLRKQKKIQDKLEEQANKNRVKEEAAARKAEEATEKKRQKEEEKEKKALSAVAAKNEKEKGSVGSKLSKSRVGGVESGGGESGGAVTGAALSIGASEGGVCEEEGDAGPRDDGDAPNEDMEEAAGSPEPGEGPGADGTDEEADCGEAGPAGGSDGGYQAAGPDQGGGARAHDVRLDETNGLERMYVTDDTGEAAHEEGGGLDEGDKGPADGQEVGHDPKFAGMQVEEDLGCPPPQEGGVPTVGDKTGPAGSGQGGGGDADDAFMPQAIRPEDDEEPDRQVGMPTRYIYIACMYVCMYACMYACMYVCMYVCTYICTGGCGIRLNIYRQTDIYMNIL
jgi:hypothetical protein